MILELYHPNRWVPQPQGTPSQMLGAPSFQRILLKGWETTNSNQPFSTTR